MATELGETESEGFAQDGSVDLRGRPVLRGRTGGSKACLFLVVYEVFERMAFYGIASNLVIYLSTKMHEGTVEASRNVNNWSGAIWMTPILGAYIADTHWGRYWTFTVFSCIYILGMMLLTLAVSLRSLRPPDCTSNDCNAKASSLQIGIFYLALYILALGTGGTKPNISTIGADQFDDFHPKEKLQKMSFFNWWMFSAFSGAFFAQTILVYVQDNVGWSVGYGTPTAGLAISLAVFLLGTPRYRHKIRTGSPFSRMAQVIVAAIRKWNVTVPADPNQLHELDPKFYISRGRYPIARTPVLRFLDKAATKCGARPGAWMLCTVTQVEETKLMIGVIPIWVATFIPSTIIAQVNTLFVKQGTTLNRHMGPDFKIPAASLTSFVTMSMLVSVVIYDRLLVNIFTRYTGNPRGITLLQRIGIGLGMHVILMAVSSLIESWRISIVKHHGLEGNKKAVVPLSVFALLPQFVLLGTADAFLEVAKLEFFYDQVPESMQSIGTALFASSLGMGNFISSFLLTTVTKITGRKGHIAWILDNLNASRLHYYYAFFAFLSFLNLIFFLTVCRFYVYKRETSQAFGNQGIALTGKGETTMTVSHTNDCAQNIGDGHRPTIVKEATERPDS